MPAQLTAMVALPNPVRMHFVRVVRCEAAHVEDLSDCDGAPEAVLIVPSRGESATGCVRHGAVLLASLVGARVYPGPGARDGDAITVFQHAQALPPFAFQRASCRESRALVAR